MAAGEGPRDWKQDDSYTFPYARGGVHSRPAGVGMPSTRPVRSGSSTVRPVIGVAIILGVIAIIAGGIYFEMHPVATRVPYAAPRAIQAPPAPTPVVYATPEAERAALMRSIPYIAGSLVSIANSGQPMPTDFLATMQGTLVVQPSGQVLGPLPYGNTIEWGADANGRVTTLTLIGATFKTRVPLDVGAIPIPAAPGSNA